MSSVVLIGQEKTWQKWGSRGPSSNKRQSRPLFSGAKRSTAEPQRQRCQ